MAVKFKELRQYLARNIRLSICFENGHYDDYNILSDIPDKKYDELYVFGIGKIDVEFPLDVYSEPSEMPETVGNNFDLYPALEVVLHDKPRKDIGERKCREYLKFSDLKGYFQIFGHMKVVMQKDWSSKTFNERKDIPDEYGDYFVYGIGMEEDPEPEKGYEDVKYDSSMKKRIVVVLSDEPRKNVTGEDDKVIYGKGPFFLVLTAEEWGHDQDEWLGIYTGKKEAGEAYDRAVSYYDEERSHGHYLEDQQVMLAEYIPEEDRFRKVERSEL
ncbi:MAG: hypothetical protein IJP84_04795 [Lachnospiraceae bacterium]|nr:hypothetical protein [Butyrivibrio sp.]MBQ6967202.1 hypothetical protein [Lachnospiraceae bacterium]